MQSNPRLLFVSEIETRVPNMFDWVTGNGMFNNPILEYCYIYWAMTGDQSILDNLATAAKGTAEKEVLIIEYGDLNAMHSEFNISVNFDRNSNPVTYVKHNGKFIEADKPDLSRKIYIPNQTIQRI